VVMGLVVIRRIFVAREDIATTRRIMKALGELADPGRGRQQPSTTSPLPWSGALEVYVIPLRKNLSRRSCGKMQELANVPTVCSLGT